MMLLQLAAAAAGAVVVVPIKIKIYKYLCSAAVLCRALHAARMLQEAY